MSVEIPEEPYLTDTYEEKLRSLVESTPDRESSHEDVIEGFLDQCKTFDGLFQEETPLQAVREQAFDQTKWKLENEI